MKIKNTINKIEVGRVYYFDIRNMLTSLHIGTKTVRVLSIKARNNASPLAEVRSIETGETFYTDTGHLQINPEILKKKFINMKYYYKKFNSKMIFKYKSFLNKSEEHIIIGNMPEVNCLSCLDKNGVVQSFGYAWFEGFDLKRNEAYDREQEQYMDDMYEEDYCEDYEEII